MWKADDRRFIFVTGKGGAGKTTVCAAMAIALARRGKRVLVALANAKERLGAMLGSGPVGPAIAAVAGGIWAVNIEPESAFEEYGRMVLKVPALHRVVFQNRYVRSFLPAVPGLSEWAMLGKAWFHTTERDPDGSPRFDVVLFDAPATGHGLDLLRVPRVIVEVVPPGVLRRDAESAWRMFRDPQATGIVVVTLPEELPVTETTELVRSIRQELGLPLGVLAVNGVLEPLFAETERDLLERIAGDGARAVVKDAPNAVQGAPDAARDAIAAAARRAAAERAQAVSLERLAALDLPQVRLPYVFGDAAAPATIEALSRYF